MSKIKRGCRMGSRIWRASMPSLFAALLAGAVAFGTGCSSDSGTDGGSGSDGGGNTMDGGGGGTDGGLPAGDAGCFEGPITASTPYLNIINACTTSQGIA